MSTILRNSQFEDDVAPLVSLEGVHVDLTSLKQEDRCFTRDELPLLSYTSAPIHPFTEGTSYHSVSNSWEKEHLKESQRNGEGAAKSRLRGLLPMYQSYTGNQSLHATSPPRHAHYERMPSPRMVGRRHNLMLKRGEKNSNERFTPKGPSPKGKKYQRMLSEGSPECEDEQEVEDEERTEEGVGADRVFATKKNRIRSGSLPSTFSFSPYQSFWFHTHCILASHTHSTHTSHPLITHNQSPHMSVHTTHQFTPHATHSHTCMHALTHALEIITGTPTHIHYSHSDIHKQSLTHHTLTLQTQTLTLHPHTSTPHIHSPPHNSPPPPHSHSTLC